MSDETRKIAVCGTAPSSLPDAPLDDPEWEIWGTSRLWKMIPRHDVWFELHDLDRIGEGWDCTDRERREQREEHLEWLAERERPVYLQEPDERVPAGVAYPLDEIRQMMRERFDAADDYFTNTISYMLALALYQDVDRVGIYGVDMALDAEYERQRPSVEYWIGVLRGAGIPVDVPATCDLLQTSHLYGFEYQESDRFREKLEARKRELADRVDQIEDEIMRVAQVRAGSLTVAEQFQEVLANGYQLPDTLERDLTKMAEEAQQQGQQADQQITQLQQKKVKMEGAKDNADYIRRSFARGS